jgi:hypothetical protein
MELTRLDLGGQVDSDFGYGGSGFGIFPPNLTTGLNESFAGSLAVEADGAIVAAGPLDYLILGNFGLGVARFTDSPSPPDADADGFLDGVDRCPFLGSPDHDGCAVVGIDLTAWTRGHRLQGVLKSPDFACLDQTQVRIVRLRKGKLARVQSITLHRQPGGSISKRFRSRRLGRGRFFARVKDQFATDQYASGPLSGQPLGAGYCLGERTYISKVP